MSEIINGDCNFCSKTRVKVWESGISFVCRNCLERGTKKFDEDKESEFDRLFARIKYLENELHECSTNEFYHSANGT